MTTVNDALRSIAVSHQIYLQRYTRWEIRQIINLLNQVDADLVNRIVAKLEGSFTRLRMERMLKDVDVIFRDLVRSVEGKQRKNLGEYIAFETGYQIKKIQSSVPINLNLVQPSPNQIWAAANARVFGSIKDPNLLTDIWSSWGHAKAKRVGNALRRGFVEGKPIEEIARQLRGTKAANYADGILGTGRRNAEVIARAAVGHMSAVTRELTYQQNDDVVKGEQWVSTLDGKTTAVCIEHDGAIKLFDGSVDQWDGLIPNEAHWGCRSSSCPVLRSWKELGIDLAEAPPGTRASMTGQVAETETYSSWFGQQDAKFQKEVLGPARYELFKGGTKFDRFIDNGQWLTLDQLKGKE